MGSNTEPDTAIRIAELSAEMFAARAEAATERSRADSWRDAGNKYYDIREWLRLCEDTPAGHTEFYTEVAEIIFPDTREPESAAAIQDRIGRLHRALAAAHRALADIENGDQQ